MFSSNEIPFFDVSIIVLSVAMLLCKHLKRMIAFEDVCGINYYNYEHICVFLYSFIWMHDKSTATISLESDRYCIKYYLNVSVSNSSTTYWIARNIDGPLFSDDVSSVSVFIC